jgi:hypothetical protein
LIRQASVKIVSFRSVWYYDVNKSSVDLLITIIISSSSNSSSRRLYTSCSIVGNPFHQQIFILKI